MKWNSVCSSAELSLDIEQDKNSDLFKWLEELRNEQPTEYEIQDSLGNRYITDGNPKREYKIIKKKKGKRYIRKLNYDGYWAVICYKKVEKQ